MLLAIIIDPVKSPSSSSNAVTPDNKSKVSPTVVVLFSAFINGGVLFSAFTVTLIVFWAFNPPESNTSYVTLYIPSSLKLQCFLLPPLNLLNLHLLYL